jgi:hypothetical protein
MATPFETKYIFMSFDLSTTSVMKYIYIYIYMFEKYTGLIPSSILL